MTLATALATVGLVVGWACPARAGDVPDAQVIFATGEVAIRNAKDQVRMIADGEVLVVGDTLLTGTGRAQLRFSDGGIVDLAPQSAFRLDDYAFAGTEDGTERKFMTLVKGFLRTLSGAIGHAHRDAYRLDTPVATIGIRGTSYTASLGEGLIVNVGEGEIEVANAAGRLIVARGEGGYVRDAATPPVKAVRTAAFVPKDSNATPKDDGNAKDNGAKDNGAKDNGDRSPTHANNQPGAKDPTTSPDTTPGKTPLRTETGDLLTHLTRLEIGGAMGVSPRVAGADTLGDASALPPNGAGKGAKVVQGTSDDLLGWGRWSDGTAPINVVVGAPTLDLPHTGSARYALDGGSGPSYGDGSGGTGKASGGMVVNFGGPRTAIGVDLTFAMNDGGRYRLTSEGGLADPNRSQIVLGHDGVFGADGLAVAASAAAQRCAAGCTGALKGFFAGTAAERAALAYGIVALPDVARPNATPVLSGIATLTKTPGSGIVQVDAPVLPGK